MNRTIGNHRRMQDGTEIWAAADAGTKSGCARSANVMRAYALAAMLAKAENAILMDDPQHAVQALRELNAHTEKLIGHLAPDAAMTPRLVAA